MKSFPRILILVSLTAASPAFAQTGVWRGTNDANWNVNTNWDTGSVPTAGTVFIVNGTTALVNDDRSGGSIGNTFVGQGAGNGGVEVTTGGSLKVGGLLVGRDSNRLGTATVSGGTLTVNQLIVGDGRGNTDGGRGTFNLSSGTVSVATDFTLGASANNVTAGTVNMSGGSLTSTNLVVGLAGAGTFLQSGGTSTITGTSFLIASNSARNSVLNLSGTAVMHASNATVRVGGSGSGTGGVGLFAGGTLNAAGVLVAASSSFTDLGGTLNVTGGITNNGTWILNTDVGSFTRSYSIVGTGGLTKAGANTLTLAATNGYTGDTSMGNGNIQLGIANAISTNSVLRFNANASNRRLQLDGFDQTLGGVDSTLATGGILSLESAADSVSDKAATLTLNVAAGQSYNFSGLVRNAAGTAVNSALTLVKSGAGTQVLSGGANVSYSGTTTVNAGVLEFGGTNTVANNSAITLSGGTVRFSGGGTRSNTISGSSGTLEKTGANTLTLSGNNSFSGGTLISGGTLQFTNGGSVAGNITNNAALLFNRTDSATVGNVISGSGVLTKSGAGTVTLSGNNTYTGVTVVNAGQLILSGSVTSDVTIGAAATLAGLGTITGGLSFASGANFVFDLNGPLIVNGGTVSFQDFSMSNLVGLTSAVDVGRYTLIDGTATFNFANVSNFGETNKFDIGDGKFAFFDSGSFVVEVVPEPSTYALLALAAAGLGAHVVRRRRSR